MMFNEGLKNIFNRHARIGQMTRDGVKALGLSMFADEKHASNTVSAVAGSNGLDIKELRRIMQADHKVILAGGQQRLDGKIFRVGHLGLVNETDIEDVLSSLKVALPKAGFISVK